MLPNVPKYEETLTFDLINVLNLVGYQLIFNLRNHKLLRGSFMATNGI